MEIHNYGDLLFHFPYRYVDRSYFTKVTDLHYEDSYVQLKGKIDQIKESGIGRYKKLSARFSDGTGDIQLIWFQGISGIKSSLAIDKTYLIFGKPKVYSKKWSIPHPK